MIKCKINLFKKNVLVLFKKPVKYTGTNVHGKWWSHTIIREFVWDINRKRKILPLSLSFQFLRHVHVQVRRPS